jgi:hypothetical protein
MPQQARSATTSGQLVLNADGKRLLSSGTNGLERIADEIPQPCACCECALYIDRSSPQFMHVVISGTDTGPFAPVIYDYGGGAWFSVDTIDINGSYCLPHGDYGNGPKCDWVNLYTPVSLNVIWYSDSGGTTLHPNPPSVTWYVGIGVYHANNGWSIEAELWPNGVRGSFPLAGAYENGPLSNVYSQPYNAWREPAAPIDVYDAGAGNLFLGGQCTLDHSCP